MKMTDNAQTGNVIFDFSGKRYLVTGASSGIGRCIATELAAAGAQVLAIARREDKLRELQLEAAESITFAALDVNDTSALEKAIGNYTAAQGKLSGTVHAAGFAGFTPLRTFSVETANKLMATSLWAGIELIRLASKKKAAEPHSAHIMLSSVAGIKGQTALTAYAATKSAINGAVRSLALELAPAGIRVNAISPGWVETPLAALMDNWYPGGRAAVISEHPLGIGQPLAVANMALFLLSARAGWITGTNMVVDGGYSA